MARVFRYGYVTVSDLNIDESYQRPVIPAHLKKIIKNYDESQVGMITVSERPDKSLWVLDGQHTEKSTAAVVGENAKLYAKIFEGLTVKEEAEIFRELNSNKRAVTSNDKLRARFIEGDPLVTKYVNALNGSGVKWTFASGGKSGFNAHSDALFMFDKYGEPLINALQIISETGNKTNRNNVVGLCYLMTHCNTQALNILRLKTILAKADEISILAAKKPYTNTSESHSYVSTAKAMCDLYNKGLRKNKLKIEELKEKK